MKLKIAALIFWAGGISLLVILKAETFQMGFFGLLLTIATLTVFAVRAFLLSGGDD